MSINPPDTLRLVAMGLLLAAAMHQDVLHRRIPNTLVLAGALTGLGLSLAPMGVGLGSSCLGGVVGLLGFGLFYMHRLLGAGDAKLVSALGFFTGYPSILMVSVSILLAGGLLSIVWGAWTSQLLPAWANLHAAWQRLGRPSKRMPQAATASQFTPIPVRVPFAIAIAAGAGWQMVWPWHLF